jgi:hypothetical protein
MLARVAVIRPWSDRARNSNIPSTTVPPGPVRQRKTCLPFICLDKYMLFEVYQRNGIRIRNHCGAEPPRDPESPSVVTTLGEGDRASASYTAADRVQALASAARGRFRGIHGGRTAPSLRAETRTASGDRCLAGSVPSFLVRTCGCPRTPPRSDGLHESVHETETKTKKKTAAQTAIVTKEK